MSRQGAFSHQYVIQFFERIIFGDTFGMQVMHLEFVSQADHSRLEVDSLSLFQQVIEVLILLIHGRRDT